RNWRRGRQSQCGSLEASRYQQRLLRIAGNRPRMAILATQPEGIRAAPVQELRRRRLDPDRFKTMKNPVLLLALAALPCGGFAADLSGTWKSEFDSQIGRQKYTYTLKQEGDKLTGKANSEVNEQKRETELSEGKV